MNCVVVQYIVHHGEPYVCIALHSAGRMNLIYYLASSKI